MLYGNFVTHFRKGTLGVRCLYKYDYVYLLLRNSANRMIHSPRAEGDYEKFVLRYVLQISNKQVS